MCTKTIILLVEDNEDEVALTRRALRRESMSFELVVARSGIEALDYLFGMGSYFGRDLSVQPSLILLDIKLPGMSGLDVLQRLRMDPRTRLIPTVMLTSSDEHSDVVESYLRGANSYVRKPIDFNEFANVVRQLGGYWLEWNLVP
ncbi:MAG TPA: response regulator [Aggregatilinea sp.]|jgi:CheY-like chemotaxis protein|uniref:response regulator n=1 Tax=Aggregatilinea sp. TaxID=2806333 RepID=UPI002CD6E456|nr:response regulator [Aggregatilinea sp.]HML21666.1 response regulator [Aggregatilinea sp.]